MYPFFESIRLLDGVPENLSYHQARVNKALADHQGLAIDLNLLAFGEKFPNKGLYKWRISYNTRREIFSELVPYTATKPKSVKFVTADHIIYRYKHENRSAINELLANSMSDDIVMIQQGLITDASYANVAFYNGIEWHTPETPMLEGTQRAKLIDLSLLKRTNIHIDDLGQYQCFKRINALMTWEETPNLPMDLLG
jgi:4-amino-4-deoxychorismate lyase